VPLVCAHALRGTHSSLAEAAGATSHLVAEALGHTSSKVTHAHYTSAEAVAGAKQQRVLQVLDGGLNRCRIVAEVSPHPFQENGETGQLLETTLKSGAGDGT